VNLDGRSYRTAVSGTLGDLARTLPVQVRLCTPGTGVNLGSGQHRLLVQPGVFTMTDVTLRSEIAGVTQAQAPAARPALARALTVLSWRPDRRQVRIGPGQAAYVEVHQNANPGWRATLDGRRLAPARLDGWQQAYLVPAGAGGVITMTFAPATLYHAGLAGSALAVLILLGAALPWKRRRRAAAAGPPDDGPAAGPAGPTNGAPAGEAGAAGATGRADGAANGPAVSTTAPPANGTPADALGPRHAAGAMRGGSGLRRWAGPLAVAGLIVAVGGPVALAVPVLAVIALLRPRALPAISLAAMLAAGAIAATAVAPAATGSGAFGPAAQVLALVALAAALYPAGAGAPDARDGWRPSRPLPGLGRRLMLPPGPGGQPEPPAGQAGPLSIGGPR
jgi:arabinofuranan 3-O-arabinosyltransferase